MAELAAGMLEARGIRTRVIGDDAGGTAPHFNLAQRGGYSLAVADADGEAATELLADLPDARPDGTEADAWTRPAAPVIRFTAGIIVGSVVVAVVWQAIT